MTDLLIPALLATICTVALWKKESAYDLLVEGATDGLGILKSIVPTLVILMTGISMLRTSGAFDLLSAFYVSANKYYKLSFDYKLLATTAQTQLLNIYVIAESK